jgi:SAM-dependent methyltransferase
MSQSSIRRTTCRLCRSRNLELVLSLTPTPPANAFITAADLDKNEERFPLDVFFCRDCAHVQLLDVVDPSVLFKHYVYVSGTSPVFVNHFKKYAAEMIQKFKLGKGAFVVEIGSNDGTLLRFFKDAGLKALGIDPAEAIAREATQKGIETIPTFFTGELAEAIRAKHGQADLVVANNVFAHADDLHDIVKGIRTLLKPHGVYVFEVSYLADVYEKTLFDTIYHEHLCYHTVKPLRGFFKTNGMELIAARSVDTHGGSLRAMAQLAGGPHRVEPSVAEFIRREETLGLDNAATLKGFSTKINQLRDELNALLRKLKSEGKRIAAFGAPAKATTLMLHFGIGPEFVDFIVDDSPLKQGLYSPAFHIPVVPSSEIDKRKPDYLVILAWNFAEPIIAKHAEFRERGGHFIIPVPAVRVVCP